MANRGQPPNAPADTQLKAHQAPAARARLTGPPARLDSNHARCGATLRFGRLADRLAARAEAGSAVRVVTAPD